MIQKVKIDGVSVTLDIQDHFERQHILQQMDALVKLVSPGTKDQSGETYRPGSRKGYRRAVTIHPTRPSGTPSSAGMMVQADPWYPNSPFMRFSWNPSRLHRTGFDWIKKGVMISVLDGWHERLIAEGNASRVDLAIDLGKVALDDIIIQVKQMRAVGAFTGTDGKTETLYFGKEQSNQVCAYDLHRRAKAKGEPVPTNARTRIEWRYRNGVKVRDLPELPIHPEHSDIWQRVVIHQPDTTAWKGYTSEYAMLRNNIQMRGMKRTIDMLPDHKKIAVKAYLAKSKAEWWNPAGTWKYWDRALRIAGLLAPTPEEHVDTVPGVPKAPAPET